MRQNSVREQGSVLSGRRALVTGAGSGIGCAIALAFAENGSDVFCADIKLSGAEDTASAARAFSVTSYADMVDVRDSQSVTRMFAAALEALGHIDVLVNAAGIAGPSASILDIGDHEWDDVVAVNLRSLFLCGRAAGRHMASRGRGVIINVTSQLADVAQRDCPAYVASKGGGKLLTKSMALDLAKHGVRVNAIAPGLTHTAMTSSGEHTPERERALRHIPMGRVAMPSEIAGAAVYLASDAASYVTGTTIVVDGGYLSV